MSWSFTVRHRTKVGALAAFEGELLANPYTPHDGRLLAAAEVLAESMSEVLPEGFVWTIKTHGHINQNATGNLTVTVANDSA